MQRCIQKSPVLYLGILGLLSGCASSRGGASGLSARNCRKSRFDYQQYVSRKVPRCVSSPSKPIFHRRGSGLRTGQNVSEIVDTTSSAGKLQLHFHVATQRQILSNRLAHETLATSGGQTPPTNQCNFRRRQLAPRSDVRCLAWMLRMQSSQHLSCPNRIQTEVQPNYEIDRQNYPALSLGSIWRYLNRLHNRGVALRRASGRNHIGRESPASGHGCRRPARWHPW